MQKLISQIILVLEVINKICIWLVLFTKPKPFDRISRSEQKYLDPCLHNDSFE